MKEAVLDVQSISIAFGGIKAVTNLSFKVEKGQIVSLIGPNGAGKTTVFNLLTGVYRTQTGKIVFEGNEIHRLRPQEIVRQGLSRTFQNIRLFSDMRVLENVLTGTHIHTDYRLFQSTLKSKKFRHIEADNIKKCLELLYELNLYNKKDEYAGSLPYGDQRKVEIARALATGARVLLLDEPAAGMNPQESAELLAFIRKLKSLGITVVLIEHDIQVVMNVSDYLYVLENGCLIAEGNAKQVSTDKKVISAYLGGEVYA